MSIRQLSQGTPSTASQIPFYDPNNGRDRRCSLSDIASVLDSLLTAPSDFVTQYAAPNASGFSVTVMPVVTGESVWLLMTPSAGYAAGTIVLPAVAACQDGQELLVSSTQAVDTLTVDGSGATVNGAPAALAANGTFRLRFDQVLRSWYVVGGGTAEGGGGGGDVTLNGAQTLTNKTLTAPVLGGTITGTYTFGGTPTYPASRLNGIVPIANLASGTPNGSKFVRDDGVLAAIPGGGDALTSSPLSQFAATTSAQLAGVVSDETGSGSLVFANSPALVTPALGTPSAINLANATNLPLGGVAGLGTGVATFLATPSSANLAAAVTGETGTGALVFGTSPTITTPTFSGITAGDGANVTTAAAMAALAIDVTKYLNTKAISADSTFTFSGTPATANTWFAVRVNNNDSAPHIITFPSALSQVTQAARTTCPIAANGRLLLVFCYTGFGYEVYGDGPFLNNFAATTDPAVGDDVADGYGVGSLWGNQTTNALFWCESAAAGAAVWNQVGGSGYLGIPQVSQSAAYTAVLSDAGKHIFHPSADTTARTFTIPANASVAYPIGTTLTFVNQNGGGVITIATTTDTTRLAGAGTTGNRTLAANGIATALKVTATEWLISGTGLT